jgi:hypothetical protein
MKLNSNSSSGNTIESYLSTQNETNSHPTKFFIDSLLSKNNENISSNTNAAAVAAAFLHQQMMSKMFSNNDQLAQVFNQNLFSAFAQKSTECQVKK